MAAVDEVVNISVGELGRNMRRSQLLSAVGEECSDQWWRSTANRSMKLLIVLLWV